MRGPGDMGGPCGVSCDGGVAERAVERGRAGLAGGEGAEALMVLGALEVRVVGRGGGAERAAGRAELGFVVGGAAWDLARGVVERLGAEGRRGTGHDCFACGW